MTAPSTARADDATPAWHGTLAAGPLVFPKYTGGKGYQELPLPLAAAAASPILERRAARLLWLGYGWSR